MAMFKMVYVGCDGCGAPASEPVDSPKEARDLMPSQWLRKAGPRGSKGKDYCPLCAPAHREVDFTQGALPLG